MPATIDYTTEPNLTTLFNTVAINEATLYMGLDPAVAKEFQPADVEKYLLESLHTIETCLTKLCADMMVRSICLMG